MSWTEAPEVKVGNAIAVRLDHPAYAIGQAAVRHHVEQDRAGVAHQAPRPAGDDTRAEDAGERVHPEPPKRASQQQADDDHDRDRRVGDDVNDGGPHVVVAVGGAEAVSAMLMLLEQHGMIATPDMDMRGEGVRLGNGFGALQPSATIHHPEDMPGIIRTPGLDRHGTGVGKGSGLGAKPENRWHPVLEHCEAEHIRTGVEPMLLVMVVPGMIVTVVMSMMMMVAAAQEPGAGDIDREPEHGDRMASAKRIGTGWRKRVTAS